MHYRVHGLKFAGAMVMLVLLATLAPAVAADLDFHYPDWKTVPIEDHDLGGGVHMLESFGGNIGVIASDDGVLLIDAEYPELTDRIRAIVKKISPAPIRYVVNTHYHWDHVGGDANFARTGATVISSEQTLRYILERQASGDNPEGQYAPDPKGAPTITVGDHATIQMGDETVELIHLSNVHTDGDLLVRFVNADVIQTGDAFFNGFYPFIDVAKGGSIDGMIALCDTLYEMSGPNTKIIPGHGAIADREYTRVYGKMLRTVRDRVAAAIADGKTLDQLIAEKPLADLDPEFGGNLIKAPTLLQIVYADLSRKRP